MLDCAWDPNRCLGDDVDTCKEVVLIMNRQAKLAGVNEGWRDYGAVTWIEAAKRRCMQLHDLSAVSNLVEIEVREQENPALVRTFTMQRVISWQCLNPRQGV